MSGTEWLRSLTRRRPKYATGGLVPGPQPGDAPLAPIGQSGCAWPADSAVVRVSPGVVMVPRDLPVPDELLIAMNAPSATPLLRRQLPAEPARRACPCIAIYSSCRCTER